MWKCSVCSYIHEGDEPPKNCPKCGAPKEKFVELESEKVELIKRSRLSNILHAKLLGLLDEASSIADKGLADKLDQPCVDIFIRVKEEARITQQMIKAEIEIHIGKGKWG